MREKMRRRRQMSKVFIFAKFCLFGTNAALGGHWSCVKRCAEDGKCQKYLFSQNFACLGLMLCSAVTGHVRKDAQKTINVFKMAAYMSIKLVHQYIILILIANNCDSYVNLIRNRLILTRKLRCEPGYFEP